MLSLTFANTADSVAEALDAAEAFCEEAGVPPRAGARLGVVLDELLSNVVNHAFAPEATGRIDLRLQHVGQEIEGEVVDDGRAFDPDSVAAPDTELPVEDRPIGGLGLHLVRRLTSRFDRWRSADRNHVRFAIMLDPPEEP